MKDENEKYIIQSVSRALKILDIIISIGGDLTQSLVCEMLNINSNMAYRLLMTLVDSGYLIKDNDSSKFKVSLKTLQLSRVAINSSDIRKLAMPFLEALWRKHTNASVNLAILEKGNILVIARIDSEKTPLTHHYIGRTLPAHATALGKVLLSELEENEVKSILNEHGFKKYTNKTISTYEEMCLELEKVRETQVAWDIGEHIFQDNCIATPLRDSSYTIVGAISISAFEMHINIHELDSILIELRETANQISHTLGYLT